MPLRQNQDDLSPGVRGVADTPDRRVSSDHQLIDKPQVDSVALMAWRQWYSQAAASLLDVSPVEIALTVGLGQGGALYSVRPVPGAYPGCN